jgi:thiol-disulfide isomerase/thioredoxin
MKSNYLATGFIAILFAAIGLYFGNSRAQAETPSGAATRDFFATSLPDAKNQDQALAQYKGKILLVNFWATWCHPCVQEMPELSTLQSKGKINNFQIIGIGIDSAANIQEFATKYKISYPLYIGGTGGSELLRKMGDAAGGLPFSVLIGPDGQVKKTYLGSLKIEQVKRDVAAI